MSKKVFNVFSILCFALVLCFIGCTELINPKTVTDINLNIDLSKIIKSTRNTEEIQSSVSIGENPTIKVAIYDAKKYNATTNSTDNLDLITEAQAKIVNNEAKVKLNNIPVGIDAIVFAELSFSNGNSTEVMYAGNSEVFRVKPTDNKISLVLIKVEVDIEVDIEVKPDDSKPEEIINAKEPEIIIQPISCVKTTTESTTGGTTKTTLTCTAKSTDGGNLSFMWYKSEDSTYFEEFYSIVGPSLNDDGSYTSSTSEIEAQIGQRLYFYCVVTNTNENATGNKVASVRSNTVQVACIEGILSSISATYKSDSYELLGKNFNYNNVTVEETYKSGSDDNAITTITVIADESRYTISPTTDSKDAIGYVPYTVTYKDTTLPSNLTASLIVPVKYELDANNLVLETYFNSSSVSVSDTENKINIPQYGTVKYSYQISDNDTISFIDKNGDNTEIKDINNTGYYTATIVDEKNEDIPNGSICTSDGSYKYTVTLKSANEWFICNSNTSKDFSVKVCPWEIILTMNDGTAVDKNNISLGTYTLSISNDAYTSTSQNLPPATFSCLVNDNNIITNNELTIDEVFTTGTITASIGNIEVASLEISRIDTSTYETFILRQRDTDGKEVTDVTGASISSLSEGITKVTVKDSNNSESVWTFFVKPENNTRFVDDGNYKVSVELKACENETTVVGIAAARADYFFTVNSDWTPCEFETGYVKGSTDHDFTIGLGLSSEIQIKNLKIEKLETTGTSEPSLVFDISKDAINSYLEQENRPENIVDVTKEATNISYNITINTPMCHSTGTDDSYIQDVKLHLRSYATNNTGANNVSFNITNTGRNDFETSVMADTANDKSISWNNNATKFSENNGGNFSVDFPNYKANDELIVDLITSSTSTSQNNSTSFILSNFKVGKAEEPPFSDKIFVYKTNANDGKGDVFAKLEDSSTISINSRSQINFDVLMFNNDAWHYENNSLTDNAFDEATRFIFADSTSTIGNLTYNVSQDNDGNPIYTLQNNTDIPVTVKISLNENYEVVIEEVTGATITSWDNLKSQIEDLTNSNTIAEFVITEELTATSTITVNKPIKIIAESPVTITRGNTTGNTSFTDVFFKVETSGSLELEGKENSTITLDGGKANEISIEAEAPLITSSGNLTLTNCTLQNNTLNNTVQGVGNGGAVYVSGGTFTMNNSSIIDCSANVNGGAVYITDKGIFNMNDDASIRNCNATNSGGGVWMNSGSSFTMSGDSNIDSCNSKSEGGGVYVTGEGNPCTFKMIDSATITGCSAVNGGAVYVSGGTFTMNNLGTISYCNAKDGGAVYITDGGTFTMNDDASISNCNATNSGGGDGGGDGGGVWMNSGSSFTMSGGKIERCNSDFNGGGVYVTDSSNTCTFKMLDSATITECSAVNGGGIYLYGKLTMNGGTISYNSAPRGAGVYVGNGSSSFTMNGGTISYNTATESGGGVYLSDSTSSFTMNGGAYVDSSNDVYLANGTTVTVAGELTNYDIVATITPFEYKEGIQVLNAENVETLANYVGKFALSDETYSIGNDGKIASNQSSEISLTQDKLNEKVETNTSGDSYYELEAGEYCVSANLILEYPIQINASGGEVKLYSNANYTISCAEIFNNSANSAMIVLPMSAGTLTLGGGNGTLTIDGTTNSTTKLDYLVMSSGTFNLSDKVTITNGNVNYGAVYIGGGTFNMTGGEIKNNKATQSSYSGIYVLGNINIEGGSICDNYACDNYAMETNYGASIYNPNSNEITILGQIFSANGGHFTKNIIDGKVEDVATSGGTTTSYSVGDVYLKDGTPIGVVFKTDTEYVYIVGLEEENCTYGTQSCANYIKDVSNVTFDNSSDGCQNMTNWYSFITTNSADFSSDDFPAFYYCLTYRDTEGEAGTWYLPASQELSIIQSNIETLNNTLQNQDSTEIGTSSQYWSSTYVGEGKANIMGMLSGSTSQNTISTNNYVRPCKRIKITDSFSETLIYGLDTANAVSVISNISAGEHYIKLASSVNADDLEKVIYDELYNLLDDEGNPTAFVYLDLSSTHIQELPPQTFYRLTSLKGITLPSTIETIDASAFQGCINLTKFVVPADNQYFTVDDAILLNKAGNKLISYPSATNYTIPENITSLAEYAFGDATNLTSVTIHANLKDIPSNAFYGACYLETFTVNSSNSKYTTDETYQILLSKDKTELISWPYAYKNITIPDSVTKIADYALAETGITSVVLNNVEEIGEYAFYCCLGYDGTYFKTLTIPSSVTKIGKYAFFECKCLESVEFADTNGWSVVNDEDKKTSIDVTNFNVNNLIHASDDNDSQGYADYTWIKDSSSPSGGGNS